MGFKTVKLVNMNFSLFWYISLFFSFWNVRTIVGQCAAGTTTGKNPAVDTDETTLTGATFLLKSTAGTYGILCCGFVTQWDINIATAGSGTLYAEVWRDVSGTWTLAGVNTITVTAGEVSTKKTVVVAAADQIAVQNGDYLGFKSSGATIVRYDKTANGVGDATQIVQFSPTAGHTKSDTATFAAYGVENNLEFGLQATLGPGAIPQFTAGLATTSTVTDDTAVGTTLLTVAATDPGDTVTLTLQSTTPASTAFNFNPTSGLLTSVSNLPVGTTTFVFRATDLCLNTVEHTFTLTVTNYVHTRPCSSGRNLTVLKTRDIISLLMLSLVLNQV